MFPKAVRILTIRGFDVRVDPSWLVIAALVTWSLWAELSGRYGHADAVAVPLAVLGAVLFFASVLAHELAHALEGRTRGVEIGGITLFLFGGVTEAKLDVDRPGDEFIIAAVGPYTSLVIGGALGLVVTGLNRYAPDLAALADILGVVGWINVGLAVFNLLPGAPLDGGRVLRSAIWRATGDRDRSIRWAALAGQGMGLLLIGIGLLQAFLVPAGLIGGLWFAFIGWFLYSAARSELARTGLKRLLGDRTAGSLVSGLGEPVPADAPVSSAVAELMRSTVDTVPVTRDGHTVGVVTVGDAAGVGHDERDIRRLGDIMRPLDELEVMPADSPAHELLDRIAEGTRVQRGSDRAPGEVLAVMDAGRLVGIMTRSRMRDVLERLEALEGRKGSVRR